MSDDTAFAAAADGTKLLVRHWPAEQPWAAMLMVHGIGEHSGRYDATGADFAGAGIDTHSFDLRGFGQSGGPRAYVESFDRYLDDVAERLAPLGGTGVPRVILGHSLGGLIALAYALSPRPVPDLLVLSAPALDAEIPAAKRALARALSRIAPRVALTNDISAEQLSRDPAVGAAYFADPLVYTKTTARLGATILAAMDDVAGKRSELAVPTLVIHGGGDTLVPPTASAPLGAHPQVTRRLLPQSRHESFNEPDREVAIQMVVDWLREQTA